MKVLLVEDEPTIRETVADELEKWGFKVWTSTNFEHILNDFLAQSPQLVLLDINLPYFDGFYWCRKIREVSKVPIIFLSSRDNPMDMVMAMNMGGDDFMQKPFLLFLLELLWLSLVCPLHPIGQRLHLFLLAPYR